MDILDALPARADLPPAAFLAGHGEVFAEFGARTQDSGNISYGVRIADTCYFVKTAGIPDDPRPALTHAERVRLVRNGAALRLGCDHPALPRLVRIIESDQGPLVFSEWCDGSLLRRGQLERFRGLPAAEVLAAIATILAVHLRLAAQGWVAEDFYDGCLLYDFARQRLRLIDLDHYGRGPQVNPGRRFGSSRFMAPEEALAGARIDERTTVYTLGRTMSVLLSDGTLERTPFRGDDGRFATMLRAADPAPERRFPSIAALDAAWRGVS
jgi:hypothetical protein